MESSPGRAVETAKFAAANFACASTNFACAADAAAGVGAAVGSVGAVGVGAVGVGAVGVRGCTATDLAAAAMRPDDIPSGFSIPFGCFITFPLQVLFVQLLSKFMISSLSCPIHLSVQSSPISLYNKRLFDSTISSPPTRVSIIKENLF